MSLIIFYLQKALEKEKYEMEQMKLAVAKQEHLKQIILTEKSRNDQVLL